MRILDISSPSWAEFLDKFPENLKDIYFTPDYLKLYENIGEGTAQCFLYTDGDNIALYPFMLNKIQHACLREVYFDAETAYGYGGPITTSMNEDFLNGFETAWLQYCRENRIIAEFVRFHPLIANHNIFKFNIDVSYNRSTAFLDLSKGEGRIWQEDISSKTRNMIRKALASGISIEVSTDWEAFNRLYRDTMHRLQADEYYYFRDDYFRQMQEEPTHILLGAFKDSLMIAGAIFIHYGGYFHYHLAGSNINYLKYAPNNLLMWEAVCLAIQKESNFFHMGGGRTDHTEDSLFKYKSSFTKSFSEFYIGKRVHNAEIYEKLIMHWENENQKRARLFLQYRLP